MLLDIAIEMSISAATVEIHMEVPQKHKTKIHHTSAYFLSNANHADTEGSLYTHIHGDIIFREEPYCFS